MLVKHLSRTTLKIHMYARSPSELFCLEKGAKEFKCHEIYTIYIEKTLKQGLGERGEYVHCKTASRLGA